MASYQPGWKFSPEQTIIEFKAENASEAFKQVYSDVPDGITHAITVEIEPLSDGINNSHFRATITHSN